LFSTGFLDLQWVTAQAKAAALKVEEEKIQQLKKESETEEAKYAEKQRKKELMRYLKRQLDENDTLEHEIETQRQALADRRAKFQANWALISPEEEETDGAQLFKRRRTTGPVQSVGTPLIGI